MNEISQIDVWEWQSESKVQEWLAGWGSFPGNKCWDNRTGECYRISSANPRQGVKDFDFKQYGSIAYVLFKDDEELARTEGRDALNRLIEIRNNYIMLKA